MDWHEAWEIQGPSDKLASISALKKSEVWSSWGLYCLNKKKKKILGKQFAEKIGIGLLQFTFVKVMHITATYFWLIQYVHISVRLRRQTEAKTKGAGRANRSVWQWTQQSSCFHEGVLWN